MRIFASEPGSPYPPGAKKDAAGVNFSVFSRHALWMELNLYEAADSTEPFQIFRLNSTENRTFFFWHIYVKELPAGTHYTWRVEGDIGEGPSRHRFNPNKELVDPWAYAVTDVRWDRQASCDPEDNSRSSMRAAVIDDSYDWEDDKPIRIALENSIIYEMHVGGFTRHPSANVRHPGTFAGVIEKIPYLKSLGVTHVELMPVMAFDELDVPESVSAKGLRNFWGYSTHSFYSPHPSYCVEPEMGSHQREFRDMVKALHRAGIGIILDVVFNHTAEGGDGGPWINFKGFENHTFYHLDDQDPERYLNYSGCGNTVNCNHPLVAQFIVNCLEFWVRKMHVDGFRFDLASVLARGEDGSPMYNAPVLWSIEFSRVLANTIIIAEAWDAAGLYQVGAFPGYRWAEWNGKYRDTMRRFIGGEKGLIGDVATCLSGSSDLYQNQGRLPINSINFITSHDGFTLYDLVSYNEKHNNDNGENNQDGNNQNFSWNCGVEGDTHDERILQLRRQQVKNYFAILLLSQGVPMILAGDEILRTQRGNNNAYCQDNEIGWFDWTLARAHEDILHFAKSMIAFRKRHPCLRRNRFLTGKENGASPWPDITWHGESLHQPQWSSREAQLLGFTLSRVQPSEPHVHAILNMSAQCHELPLPRMSGVQWRLAFDTARSSPADVIPQDRQVTIVAKTTVVEPRNILVFEGYSF